MMEEVNYGKQIKRLEDRVQRLQKALAFWLPKMPGKHCQITERLHDDIALLAGSEADLEPCAEELGWIAVVCGSNVTRWKNVTANENTVTLQQVKIKTGEIL